MHRKSIAIREDHFVKHFGPLVEPNMQSTDDTTPHIDIYRFGPNNDRSYWTLITGGMSDQEQFIPRGHPDHITKRTEVLMYVHEPRPWMFQVVKELALIPFEQRTYLHWWHSAPINIEDSQLAHAFFLPPYFESEEFDSLVIEDDDVSFLWMVPITESELQYKLRYGGQALEELFSNCEIDPVLNENRASVI